MLPYSLLDDDVLDAIDGSVQTRRRRFRGAGFMACIVMGAGICMTVVGSSLGVVATGAVVAASGFVGMLVSACFWPSTRLVKQNCRVGRF